MLKEVVTTMNNKKHIHVDGIYWSSHQIRDFGLHNLFCRPKPEHRSPGTLGIRMPCNCHRSSPIEYNMVRVKEHALIALHDTAHRNLYMLTLQTLWKAWSTVARKPALSSSSMSNVSIAYGTTTIGVVSDDETTDAVAGMDGFDELALQ